MSKANQNEVLNAWAGRLERVLLIFGVVEADIFEQILKVTASAMRAL